MARRHEDIRLQNIRIAVSARRHHFDRTVGVPFLCECDSGRCREFVIATLPEYERIRKERLVLVAREHAVAGGTLVAEEGDHALYRVESSRAATG